MALVASASTFAQPLRDLHVRPPADDVAAATALIVSTGASIVGTNSNKHNDALVFVANTPGKGRGVFAGQNIAAGARILTYTGVPLSQADIDGINHGACACVRRRQCVCVRVCERERERAVRAGVRACAAKAFARALEFFFRFFVRLGMRARARAFACVALQTSLVALLTCAVRRRRVCRPLHSGAAQRVGRAFAGRLG